MMSALIQHLRDRKRSVSATFLGVEMGDTYESGWVGYLFDSAGGYPPDGLMVEVSRDSRMMQQRFDLLRGEALDARFFETNTVAVVTLSGAEVDWPLVGAMWQVFNALWPAIVYDDVSGFGIDMSETPSL